MMRINLLPPEILERRKAEQRIGWVLLAAAGIAVILVGVWGYGYFTLDSKKSELASIQQQVQTTNAQATQLAIFEQRAAELEARRATVAQALSTKRDWARMMDELSLVLPSDIWLQTLTANQDGGIAMAGYALDTPNDDPDAGHKSIAKALVRIADLDELYDVWLTSSVKTVYEEQQAIQFTITAKVGTPTPEATQ
jgi:Tfp pilus assembly protein PilN